jgi:hypothetical protein
MGEGGSVRGAGKRWFVAAQCLFTGYRRRSYSRLMCMAREIRDGPLDADPILEGEPLKGWHRRVRRPTHEQRLDEAEHVHRHDDHVDPAADHSPPAQERCPDQVDTRPSARLGRSSRPGASGAHRSPSWSPIPLPLREHPGRSAGRGSPKPPAGSRRTRRKCWTWRPPQPSARTLSGLLVVLGKGTAPSRIHSTDLTRSSASRRAPPLQVRG